MCFLFLSFVVHFFLVFVYSFNFLFHANVVLTQFFIVFCEFLEHLYNHCSEFYIWLVWLPPFHFTLLVGSLSFLLLACSFISPHFRLLCLFLCFLMFNFASCHCKVNFYVRNSVGFDGMVFLFSLSVCSRFALSSVCRGSVVVLRFLHLVVPL